MIDKLLQLSIAVKVILLIGLFLVALFFMYLTFEAGMWAEFLRWIMESGAEAKK